MSTKKIILCADDYGMSAPLSEGIVSLVAKQRLSAVSCVVNFANWAKRAQALKPYVAQIDIGLHLNLTEGKPLSAITSLSQENGDFFRLTHLIKKAHFGQLERAAILTEFTAQLDLFVAEVGKLPDFIDGHQHIHHLPIIREAVVELYQQRLTEHHTYIRNVKWPLWRVQRSTWIKTLVIQFTGAHQFAKILKKNKIPHNKTFAGFYDFNPRRDYRRLFLRFIGHASNKCLIMCHPGLLDSNDPIADARLNELRYLESEQFLTDCHKHGVRLSRFK